jgi:hypothetical protein
MKSNTRDVLFYDTVISASKGDCRPPKIIDILLLIEEEVRSKKAFFKLEKGTQIMKVKDIQIDYDSEYATIFVSRGDPEYPDTVHANEATGKFDIITKDPGDANEFGAHVFFGLNEIPGSPNCYPTFIERVANNSQSVIIRLLNSIFRENYKTNSGRFRSASINGAMVRGKPKMDDFRPILKMCGHPSDEFVKILEGRAPTGIRLSKHEKGTNTFGAPYLNVTDKYMDIRIIEGALPKNDRLINIARDLARAGGDWEKARIYFKDDDDAAKNVDIDLSTQSPIDGKFIKSFKILKISPGLSDSSVGIVNHFQNMVFSRIFEYL